MAFHIPEAIPEEPVARLSRVESDEIGPTDAPRLAQDEHTSPTAHSDATDPGNTSSYNDRWTPFSTRNQSESDDVDPLAPNPVYRTRFDSDDVDPLTPNVAPRSRFDFDDVDPLTPSIAPTSQNLSNSSHVGPDLAKDVPKDVSTSSDGSSGPEGPAPIRTYSKDYRNTSVTSDSSNSEPDSSNELLKKGSTGSNDWNESKSTPPKKTTKKGTRNASVSFASLPASHGATLHPERRKSSITPRPGHSPHTTPRQSISVQNVVIPAHLVRHVETSWNQDKIVNRRLSNVPRTDPRSVFNIEKMARDQQSEVQSAVDRIADSSNDGLKSGLRKASIAPGTEKKIAFLEPFAPSAPQRSPVPQFGEFSFSQQSGDGVSRSATSEDPDPHTTKPFSRKESRLGSLWRKDFEFDQSGTAMPSARKASRMGSIFGYDQQNTTGERRGTIFQRSASVFQDTMYNVKEKVRRSSLWDVYENAKKRQVEIKRKRWAQLTFQYSFYVICIAVFYFGIIGEPLWKGSVYWLWYAFKHKMNVPGTWSVVIGVALLYAYSPLLVLFEDDPPMPEDISAIDPTKTVGVADTALMIPCYKAATLIGPTLEAAVKIFPPSQIFVIANGNSPTPLDNTEEICDKYGVNHIWSPVGSKIVAQFVGCYAAKEFKNVLLIDDDCALPPNFPIVSERMTGKVKCMGYTIKSVGPNSSKGTLCQQAQDLEYKISGLQRALAGKMGSATFPHGAISLWDRHFLIQTFNEHPGFSVSEDWFFGHVARKLGCRTKMCTSVFIETETPDAIFISSGGERGGFGEMTVFKQRFLRWNFFFVNGMYYNMAYIIGSWKLGWWELGAKLFVFQEVYETLLYLATPFVLPISIIVRFQFSLELLGGTFLMYFVCVLIFNEVHLRRKNERIGWKCLWLYYMPYKFILTMVNVASCYWAIYKYATYFANRHAKIIEDDKAINVVLQLEEAQNDTASSMGRRMTVTSVGSQTTVTAGVGSNARRMTITTVGPRLSEPDISAENEKSDPTISGTGPVTQPRRASITVRGRKISIVGFSDDAPNSPDPAGKSGRGRLNSDAIQSRVIGTSRRKASITPAPINPVAEEGEESAETDELVSRLNLIQQELATKNVEVLDFSLETPGLGILIEEEGEEEDEEESSIKDTRKTSDSKSMV